MHRWGGGGGGKLLKRFLYMNSDLLPTRSLLALFWSSRTRERIEVETQLSKRFCTRLHQYDVHQGGEKRKRELTPFDRETKVHRWIKPIHTSFGSIEREPSSVHVEWCERCR